MVIACRAWRILIPTLQRAPPARTSPIKAGARKARAIGSQRNSCALSADFETHGETLIETVRTSDPATYLRVVASLQRQEIEVHATPEERLKDDELEHVYQQMLAGRPEPAAEPAPVVAKGSERVN